ncbi:hypothetical protein NEDG_01544 [Nematocida displodere]|uniref:SAC domain-containing protein n=1 Tax=Nematocida displodere TaxID=1805483 RepID=A0A177EDI0_9MICR|nr:hypothetical protein NEDG_01544 [Nematocida displodere]
MGLDSGRMLIREGSCSVLLTYLKDTRLDEDAEAVRVSIPKGGSKKDEKLNGGSEFYGVFGEVDVNSGRYLVYVKEAKKVGVIRGKCVYEAKSAGTILIEGLEDPAVHEVVASFFKIPGLLFSDEDLSEIEASENTDFIFNYIPLSKFLQKRKDGALFGIKAIQGFYGEVSLSKPIPIECFILSRRSWKNAGTRYCARGADTSGNAANTVETVFVCAYEGAKSVLLQCRGSIPLSWEQKIDLSYKPPVKMGSSETNEYVFQKHLDVLKRRYGEFFIITLLDRSGHEKELCEAFDRELESGGVGHLSVNYHQMIKHPEEKRKFRQDLREILDKKITIRTNCVDCLDRTNVVQSQIAKINLARDLGLETETSSGAILDIDDYLDEKETKKLAQLWNSNGNVISMQYTGTSALKNDLTEHGVRTFKGLLQDAISSGKRYVNNNFTDGKMQETIEVVVGVRHTLENFTNGDVKTGALAVLILAVLMLVLAQKPSVAVLFAVAVVVLTRVLLFRSLSFPSPLSLPARTSPSKRELPGAPAA